MLGSDIATRVKESFGDEAGAQITDAMILRWINDAQNEIVARTEELFQKKQTAATVVGQMEYDLPTAAPNIIRLHRVIYKGRRLEPISIQVAEDLYPDKDVTPVQTGTPVHYWIWADKLTLMPAPSEVTNLTLYYQAYPTAVAVIGDPLTLPVRYHLRVKDYCIAQAAELDDDDSRALTKIGQFQADIDAASQDTTWENQNSYPFIQPSSEDVQYGY